MEDKVRQFYEQLSGDYHLLFEDWHRSCLWQGEILDRLIQGELGMPAQSVLDCCCGIGTQAIGLASRGLRVHASDLTARAVERAKLEADRLGLSMTFGTADVRSLAKQVEGTFDVVLACDNSLPHLLTDADMHLAATNMAAKLRPGGLFLASTRDYDDLVRQQPRFTPPRIFENPQGRRIQFQLWDWSRDGRSYHFQQFILQETGSDWTTSHHACSYRAWQRQELTEILQQVGLAEVRWHLPEESGYYQPIVTAHRSAASDS
jgi:2-polyprenyl-3-methyl-5-hydroxy-6-metoxy-1,4-benzoquinol methylase